MAKRIEGFSKKTKSEKIDWITQTHFDNPDQAKNQLEIYWNDNLKLQKRHDEFIENTLTNFYMPLGVAPNFLINGKEYTLPMVIEESSVVAAAGNAAKFWYSKGGFKAQVLGTIKVGHVHFTYGGNSEDLKHFFKMHQSRLIQSTQSLTKNMEARGGGIESIELVDKTDSLANYYHLYVRFKTADAMGANFINSCLECIAKELEELSAQKDSMIPKVDVVMSILSNYVPECIVQAEVSCSLEEIESQQGMSGDEFAKKIIQAVSIADCEPYRAVTHNKGIMNGVDALILATGNDFRAIEAGVHAYASRSGRYRSLSSAQIENGRFRMKLQIPLALGTVGGLTKLHPLVSWSMKLLGNPNAQSLMEIVAVAGLAQNFAALRSLVTSGIQKGHMKMHLLNILNQFQADDAHKKAALEYFKTHTVSVKAVGDFLQNPLPQ
ncbi:MAG: hydroxymethylglutaryl-CoA reductase, degradative [Flavobacteriaceae bacterium]